MAMNPEAKGTSARRAEDSYKADTWKGLDLINESSRPNTGTHLLLQNCVINNNSKVENRRGFEQLNHGPDVEDPSGAQGFAIYKNKIISGIERIMFIALDGILYASNLNINKFPNIQWVAQEYEVGGVLPRPLIFQKGRKVTFKQIDRFLFFASGEGIFVYDGDAWKDITTTDAYEVNKLQLEELGYNIAHPDGAGGIKPYDDNTELCQIIQLVSNTTSSEGEFIPFRIDMKNIPVNLKYNVLGETGGTDIKDLDAVMLVFITRADLGNEITDADFVDQRLFDVEPTIPVPGEKEIDKVIDSTWPSTFTTPESLTAGSYFVKYYIGYVTIGDLTGEAFTLEQINAIMDSRKLEHFEGTITPEQFSRCFSRKVIYETSIVVTTSEDVASSTEIDRDDIRTCNLVETYKGRVYLAGSKNLPRVIFSSDIVNYDYFPFFQSFEPLSDKFESFTWLKKRRDTLLIPSASEFPILVGDGPITAEGLEVFSTKVLYPNVGVIAPRSLKFVDANLIYLSNDGIRLSKPNTFDENSILTIKRIDKSIRDIVVIDEDAIAFFKDGKYYLMYPNGEGLIYDFDHNGQWSSFKTNLEPMRFHLEDQGINYFISDTGSVFWFNKDIYVDKVLNEAKELVNVPVEFDILPNAFTGNINLDNTTKNFKRVGLRFAIKDEVVQEFKVNVYVNGVDTKNADTSTLIENEAGELEVEVVESETFLEHTGLTKAGSWVLGNTQNASVLPNRISYNLIEFQLNLRNGQRAAKGEAITVRIRGEATEKFEFSEFNFTAINRKKRRQRGQIYK
jgi:hypothetical protein